MKNKTDLEKRIEKFDRVEERIRRGAAAAVRWMPVIAVIFVITGSAFGQTTPTGNASQIGAIARWLLWIVVAPLLAVMGVFKLIGAWGMYGNGQQGWIPKAVAGLGFMMFPALIDVALQIARGETPDLGLGGVLGNE